jgi:glyoxalase family protein
MSDTNLYLTGIHHLTAVTANATANLAFYTGTLGLRLVKKTVNQDDTNVYHLFYADGDASPGTDITFFEWPLPSEKRGSRTVVRTGFRIDKASFPYWQARLTDAKLRVGDVVTRDGRFTLDFEDPEGQRLAFVEDLPGVSAKVWAKSPVPAEHQIHGLGPITISTRDLGPTETILTAAMKMRRTREYQFTNGGNTAPVHVFEMGPDGSPANPAAELHVAVEPDLRGGELGAGAVHHVAFRVPTYEDYDKWADRLNAAALRNSGKVDRFYFRSLYFREPGGVLFELATDEPGFAVDEPKETLGEHLALPPFLEPHRQEIEKRLKPLNAAT